LSKNKFYASLFFENHWLEEAGKVVNEMKVQNIGTDKSGTTGKAVPVSAAIFGRIQLCLYGKL
jgi:hypothetical protein